MKSNSLLTLCCAVATLGLLYPPVSHAQSQAQDQAQSRQSANWHFQDSQQPNARPNSDMGNSAMAEQSARRMVPAEARLKGNLDAQKVHPGSQIKAVLTNTATLKDGVKLPRGTTLLGKVESDRMQQSGHSTLAVRFTEAQLKNGRTIPIHATIVSIGPPQQPSVTPYDQVQSTTPWNGNTVQFEQIGAVSGTDLHSRINGKNSATFVSKKNDVKLRNGSQLALAIGPSRNVG